MLYRWMHFIRRADGNGRYISKDGESLVVHDREAASFETDEQAHAFFLKHGYELPQPLKGSHWAIVRRKALHLNPESNP
jgi:hypothetical protein